jgi:hypothetical protein
MPPFPLTFCLALVAVMSNAISIQSLPLETSLVNTTESSIQCIDPSLKIGFVRERNNNKLRYNSCNWVARKPYRCANVSGAAETCPSTCGTCSNCTDSPLRFKITNEGGLVKKKSCVWVGKTNTHKRCKLNGVSDICRKTCGSCMETQNVEPSDEPSVPPTGGCNVPIPDYIGDDYCDGGEYNTPECNYDDGDCVDFNKLENCSVPIAGYIGDDYCDGGEYNTPECNYDGGDCVDFNKFENCSVPIAGYIGDGFCDPGVYNTSQCGYDGGDCLTWTNNNTDFNSTFGVRNLFEMLLNYMYPQNEDEKLDWQK